MMWTRAFRLGKASAADLHVDAAGRVVVKNEKIASALKGALGQGVGAKLPDSVNQTRMTRIVRGPREFRAGSRLFSSATGTKAEVMETIVTPIAKRRRPRCA